MRERLLKALEERGGLEASALNDCLQVERETGQTLDRILLQRELLEEDRLLPLLAEMLGLDWSETLPSDAVPPVFIDTVPVQFARTYNLVALDEDGMRMRVATCHPLELNPLDELAGMVDRDIEPVVAPRSEIAACLNRAYRHKADGVDEALDDLRDVDMAGLAAEIQETEDVLDVANKAPIIKLVNTLIFQAVKLRASDIHMQPRADELAVRMRIDGVLYDMERIPKKAQDALISRVKIMGKMDIAERRLPQDGRATIRVGDGEVDIRISSIPTADGERVVMRLLDKTARVYTLQEIGLSGDQLEAVNSYFHYSHGIILVTGPTGSGKTTTLYAGLQAMDTKKLNILTIEDPVEYNLAGISQVQVNNKKGLTFSAGLRSFLRQDPDVMMVGEVRDLETAEIAIRAALTGHLVFSTVHTNDAPSTVTRLVDIGVDPYLVCSSLLLIVAQRLVRTVCPDCLDRVRLSPEDRDRYARAGFDPDQLPDGTVSMGRGCESCFDSGYAGRTALYEILPVDDPLRDQVMEGVGATHMKRGAVNRGMKTLRADGMSKMAAGQTTLEEVLRVTQLDVL